MFCKQGMEAVNARSVAKTLNCSTQPIFSYFSGMEDLKTALDQKAREVYQTTVSDAIEKEPGALGCCRAYVRFAKEQPRLFAHLFLRMGENCEPPKMDDALHARMLKEESELSGTAQEQTDAYLAKLWIFTHGLAALIASDCAGFTLEQVDDMLASVRGDLILGCKQA
ncbi:MAG: TetR-like C-terminal domain-containing protein [Clostridia bacterium]|nr:TetR-like C-terminal domain-containing protein [Clostridia bacterium]